LWFYCRGVLFLAFMKKIKYIFWVFSISLLFLYSCSNNNLDKSKLLKSLVETTADGTTTTTFFTYNGEKLVSIDSDKTQADFTYTAGLITKKVTLDKTNQVLNTVEYSYVNDKLVNAKSLNNYIINYVHNSDGTVSYEKITAISGTQEVKVFHGTMYFQNKNLIKDERIFDNTDPGILSSYSINYEYDSNVNPLNNILGYEKLLDHNEAISSNNCRIIAVYMYTTKDNQISSSANLYKREFKYDLEDYPIEQLTENSITNNGNSGYLKTQYFY